MIDLLICGANLSCHFGNFKHHVNGSKYPADVEQICYYFEEKRETLPEYCHSKVQSKPIRKRHEF